MTELLLNEIIELKEKRKVLEAELGLSTEDIHIFNKNEIQQIMQHENDEETYYNLEEVALKLQEDIDLYLGEH
ncbi:MAG: hypothetical protein WBA54_13470 [Acidaminobacteraceae bacterium]